MNNKFKLALGRKHPFFFQRKNLMEEAFPIGWEILSNLKSLKMSKNSTAFFSLLKTADKRISEWEDYIISVPSLVDDYVGGNYVG